MNKEPIGLYLLRYIISFGLFAFMAMLYWSSQLLEGDLKVLRSDLDQLKNDIFELRTEARVSDQEVLQVIIDDQARQHELIKTILHGGERKSEGFDEKEKKESLMEADLLLRGHRHVDPAKPNILKKDLFYAVTLPKMLGSGFRPWGVRKGADLGKPENLHPFSPWSQVRDWQDMCLVSVATSEFGKYETMAPNMAIKIEERMVAGTDTPEYWVFLRDNVYWQPLNPSHFPEELHLSPEFLRKHKVTAHDFKFFFDAVMNPYNQEDAAVALRNYIGDIEEIKIIDDLTFVVRWKTEDVELPSGKMIPKVKYIAKSWTGALRPLPRFVYQYFPDGKKIVEDEESDIYRTNMVWAQNFAEHWARNVIVSCGPWVFDGMTDRQIRFKRNPNHYHPLRVLVEAMEIEFKEGMDALWQDFKAGKTDTYVLQPNQLVELEEFLLSDEYQRQVKQGLKIHRIEYLARVYRYIGWNQTTPLFASKKVRRAMTMAIDRHRIIAQNLNGLGVEITGNFFFNSPSYDKSIASHPYDPQQARRLLEEEGWYDSDGDGIVDKIIDGKTKPFRFGLTYYVKDTTGKAICEYVATALKEIGVDCRLNGIDIADLSATLEDKSFDAIYMGWSLGTPPENPKQLWHSSGAKEKGSSNIVGFVNNEADRIIEQLEYEYDLNERKSLYHRFHRILHEEQPYTFMYTPKSILLYRDYVQNVFIPAERSDLIPGADVAMPDPDIFWLRKPGK